MQKTAVVGLAPTTAEPFASSLPACCPQKSSFPQRPGEISHLTGARGFDYATFR